mgnify:CR=1 FL=1
MGVTFRCKATGNTVTFEHQVDIDTTRDNSAYEEIENEVEVVEEPIIKKKASVKSTKE